MKWLRLLEEYALYPIIIAALGAGLAAAYGRELEQGRAPDRRWWLRRMLILPVLAIIAATITQGVGLSHTFGAFTAAMLSLGGYDLLRLIEARWRARLLVQPDEAGS